MTSYVNLHSHRKPRVEGEIAIRNAYLKNVNFQSIQYPVSIGIHPWHVHITDVEKALTLITNNLNSIIAIGECGLDRVINTPINEQISVFKAQINIAEQNHLPIIVHCVKAYSDFANLAKQFHNVQFVLHGFSGNSETLKMLLPFKNVYFSVGKHLFNPLSNASIALKEIPFEKLFLETDTTNLLINNVYIKAAEIIGIEETVLKNQIFNNFEKIFINKKK